VAVPSFVSGWAEKITMPTGLGFPVTASVWS
jgi:hypothetical protein